MTEIQTEEEIKSHDLDDLEFEFASEAINHAITAEELLSASDSGKKSIENGIHKFPIIGSERREDYLYFTLLVSPDETEEVRIKWPDSLNDSDEPLIRLLNWYGEDIQTYINLKELYVIKTDYSGLYLIRPPEEGGVMGNLYQYIPSLFELYYDSSSSSYSALKIALRFPIPIISSILTLGLGTILLLIGNNSTVAGQFVFYLVGMSLLVFSYGFSRMAIDKYNWSSAKF